MTDEEIMRFAGCTVIVHSNVFSSSLQPAIGYLYQRDRQSANSLEYYFLVTYPEAIPDRYSFNQITTADEIISISLLNQKLPFSYPINPNLSGYIYFPQVFIKDEGIYK